MPKTCSQRIALRTLLGVAWTLAALVGGVASAQAPTAGLQPVIWGQEVFAIPYQWGGQTDPSQARQVVLHLSRDGGATWRQVSVAEPRVQSFTYRAASDGEYWFAVRTIDGAGQAWPAGPLAPELHVVIDTQIPTIGSLAASIDATGILSVGCVVQDTNVDPAAVRVSVQAGTTWRDVPTTSNRSTDGRTIAVRGSLSLGSGVLQAAVRVVAKDLAGNPAGAGIQATLGAAAPAPLVRPTAPAAAAPAPFGFASTPVAPPRAAPSTPRDPFLGQAPTFGPPAAATVQPPVASAAPSATNGWSSGSSEPSSVVANRPPPPRANDTWAPDGVARAPFRGEARTLTPVQPTAPLLSARPAPPRGVPNPPSSIYRSARSASPPSTFASLSPTPSAGASLTEPSFESLATQPPAFRTAPLPEQSQFVGTQRFELDYDVESAGRWGVAKVTLWGTRDRGRTWRAFAVDSDNRSPLDVSVPEEGLYGFRIAVEGVGGLSPETPKPGDAPELWVEVDQTEPQVRLTAAHQGEGYFGDHLVINWQAEDANLGVRPITLSYASRREGPWAAMATSIENSGRYSWRLQRHLPRQLFLRVEAQDAAGNTGVAITPQPLSIDLPTPSARVRSVRPIGG